MKTLKSYECARCLTVHELPAPVKYDGTWEAMPQEVRDNRHARNVYQAHKDYAAGTDAARAFEKLRAWIRPGDTVYTILRHRSSSGMSRRISVCISTADAGIMDVSGYVAHVLGYKRHDRDGGLIVGGCGMDMGFHVVYGLARALFPAFGCTGIAAGGNRCPSNDHSNERSNGKENYKRGRVHSDSGYALNHSWL